MVLRTAGFLLAVAAAPALLAIAGDVTCTYSDSETCPVENFTPASDGSVLVYPGGNTRCAFDDYTDSKTSFKTNSTYFFQVFPNEEQDKSKVLLYFQGGGACTDKYTCNFGLECALGSSQLFTTVAKGSSVGVLNRTMEENMFKDWNVIHIPYCTGDLHIGNATTAAFTTGYEVALGNSQCLGQNKDMHMNGYNNAQSALKWALANYPNPEHLVISGYSAGSLAAQIYSSYVANMWEVESKSIKYQVLADSYVGVFPEEQTPAATLLNYFGACDVDLDLDADIVSACEDKTGTVVEIMSSVLEKVPFSDWLFIDSKGDATQRKFYELVKEGITGYPFSNVISEADFFSNMTAIFEAYEAISSKITTFNVESTLHVYTTRAAFTDYVSDEGLELGDVINAWLGSDDASSSSSGSSTGSVGLPSSSASGSFAGSVGESSASSASGSSTTSLSASSSGSLAIGSVSESASGSATGSSSSASSATSSSNGSASTGSSIADSSSTTSSSSASSTPTSSTTSSSASSAAGASTSSSSSTATSAPSVTAAAPSACI